MLAADVLGDDRHAEFSTIRSGAVLRGFDEVEEVIAILSVLGDNQAALDHLDLRPVLRRLRLGPDRDTLRARPTRRRRSGADRSTRLARRGFLAYHGRGTCSTGSRACRSPRRASPAQRRTPPPDHLPGRKAGRSRCRSTSTPTPLSKPTLPQRRLNPARHILGLSSRQPTQQVKPNRAAAGRPHGLTGCQLGHLNTPIQRDSMVGRSVQGKPRILRVVQAVGVAMFLFRMRGIL